MNRGDLKIQFRSVKWGEDPDVRVIEYRIDPNQDIVYKKEMKLLFGLFKITVSRKYSTSWIQPVVYRFWSSTHDFDVAPIFSSERWKTYKNLKWFKDKFKTVNEFECWIVDQDQKAIKEHEDYLKRVAPDVIY